MDYLREAYSLEPPNSNTDDLAQSIEILLSRSVGSTSVNYIVDSACKYIQNHYSSSSVSLKSVADKLSVSDAYLSRLFKKHTNQTFSNYLLNCRMKEAKNLLIDTNLSISKIAAMVGFENPAYFRTSFKNYFGVTPSQYRLLSLWKEGETT